MRTTFTLALSLALLIGGSAEAQIARPTRLRIARPVATPIAPAPIATSPIATSPIAVRRAPTTSTPAPRTARGELRCDVRENGVYAPASMQVRQAGRVVASGSCATPLALVAGTYDVTLTLESALDRPTQTVRVRVLEDGAAVARAAFETAILEVRFTRDRAPAPGMAVLRRNGVEIGSIGSGVAARVSAGTYDVVARYRTEQRTYTVALQAGQRRALRADF